MSFNLYFAGWGSKDADEYLRMKKVNRLCSQVNERRVIDWWEKDNLADKLFIDSGAFSVAHSNSVVNIDDYIAYINNHPKICNWAELDVIPYPVLNTTTAKDSCEKSWQNYLYMKNHVITNCNILPLYHFGEPKSALIRILNTEVNGSLPTYIGIGGRHGVSTDAQAKYFNEIFSIIQQSDNPNVKVHAFGITVPKLLERFPFYSADSTTWVQVAINGMIMLKDFTTVLISDGTTSAKTNVQTLDTCVLEVLFGEIESFGYNFRDLCADYKLRLRYNIDVMNNWAQNYIYKGPVNFKSCRLF